MQLIIVRAKIEVSTTWRGRNSSAGFLSLYIWQLKITEVSATTPETIGTGGKMWIRPYRYHILYHLPKVKADFLEK